MTYGELRRHLAVVAGIVQEKYGVPSVGLVLLRDHYHCPDEAEAAESFHPVSLTWRHTSGRMAYCDSWIAAELLSMPDFVAQGFADAALRIIPTKLEGA